MPGVLPGGRMEPCVPKRSSWEALEGDAKRGGCCRECERLLLQNCCRGSWGDAGGISGKGAGTGFVSALGERGQRGSGPASRRGWSCLGWERAVPQCCVTVTVAVTVAQPRRSPPSRQRRGRARPRLPRLSPSAGGWSLGAHRGEVFPPG